jgi:hypothetical protein
MARSAHLLVIGSLASLFQPAFAAPAPKAPSAHYHLRKTTRAIAKELISYDRFTHNFRLSPPENTLLADLRTAALHGDRSQIQTMIQVVQQRQPICTWTALLALSQLGATDALPAIEASPGTRTTLSRAMRSWLEPACWRRLPPRTFQTAR